MSRRKPVPAVPEPVESSYVDYLRDPVERAAKAISSRVDPKTLGVTGAGVVGGVFVTVAASAVVSTLRRRAQG